MRNELQQLPVIKRPAPTLTTPAATSTRRLTPRALALALATVPATPLRSTAAAAPCPSSPPRAANRALSIRGAGGGRLQVLVPHGHHLARVLLQ